VQIYAIGSAAETTVAPLPPPPRPAADLLEQKAKEILPRERKNYCCGRSRAAKHTMRANREAFYAGVLMPRMLRDVRTRLERGGSWRALCLPTVLLGPVGVRK